MILKLFINCALVVVVSLHSFYIKHPGCLFVGCLDHGHSVPHSIALILVIIQLIWIESSLYTISHSCSGDYKLPFIMAIFRSRRKFNWQDIYQKRRIRGKV